MKAAVIVFPGSNCDRDARVALKATTGVDPAMVWHNDTSVPPVDLIVLPGGFSFGDYLRSGAIAARSSVMKSVAAEASRGVSVLGICNGFQILVEMRLLPGALMRNASLTYVCRTASLRVERADTVFTNAFAAGETLEMPIAHKDGNFFADGETMKRIEGEGQIVLRYSGGRNESPNGSCGSVAGIVDKRGRILGMMPHPERACDAEASGIDGRRVFESLKRSLN